MKKMMRMLLALVLALGLLLGEAAPALAVGGAENRVQAELLAKSKKKKNTPTPTVKVQPTETPAPAETAGVMTPTPVPEGPIIDPQSIADYLFAHGELPENFITKKEAQALGWDSRWNYVSDVAPGMSIGGDRFGNYEGLLPTGKGITYKEADCYYEGGKRNAYRIIFSSDGRVWYTEDHYKTFTELFPTVP
ncbi:MAG: hypothetical protein IKE24_09095 [Clostridia bacterium]|nr:hypothetical protein [Clostridia bacterium]